MAREQLTRALLAEAGISPESAAVTLGAARGALLAVMPVSKADAKPMDELFAAAVVPSRTTGQVALRGLLAECRIQRIGKGISANPYRYFVSGPAKPEESRKLPARAQTKGKNKILKNKILVQTLRGEEPKEED